MSAGSLARLEHIGESCRVDESGLLPSEHGATFVPLVRENDRLTGRRADQIEMKSDRPDWRKIVRRVRRVRAISFRVGNSTLVSGLFVKNLRTRPDLNGPAIALGGNWRQI